MFIVYIYYDDISCFLTSELDIMQLDMQKCTMLVSSMLSRIHVFWRIEGLLLLVSLKLLTLALSAIVHTINLGSLLNQSSSQCVLCIVNQFSNFVCLVSS